MNKKELAEQILEKHMKQHMDTGQFGDINHPITFAEWANHSFFAKSAIAAIIEAMGKPEANNQHFQNWKERFYEWKEEYRRKKHKEPMAELVRDWIETNVIQPMVEAMGEKPEVTPLEKQIIQLLEVTKQMNVLDAIKYIVGLQEQICVLEDMYAEIKMTCDKKLIAEYVGSHGDTLSNEDKDELYRNIVGYFESFHTKTGTYKLPLHESAEAMGVQPGMSEENNVASNNNSINVPCDAPFNSNNSIEHEYRQALLVIRSRLNNLLNDEDLTDEKLREASEELLPNLHDIANAVLYKHPDPKGE